MPEYHILQFALDAIKLILVLSLPSLVLAASVGLLISLMQALTQVQEQTVSFVIRMITVFLVLIFTADWYSTALFNFAVRLFDQVIYF